MTSGDEPQLGGQASDNAPMISGRGTKIIVSARGAYETRSVGALIRLMEDNQLLAFKQTVVRHAHAYVIQVMERFPEMEQRLPDLWHNANRVTHWLIQGDKQIEHEFAEFVRGLSGADWNEEAGESLRMLIGALSDPFPERSADFTRWLISAVLTANEALHPPYNHDHSKVIELQLQNWHLEVAWATLQGKVVPSPPQLEVE
jgi:hypothetical protein